MDLTERKKRILRAIIESYIQSAEPVGSKAIAASIDMEVSSATIRNEMADLEAMGLLEKPHTSAGRIPSPKGYRLYVNELMEEHKLSLQETQRINQALACGCGSWTGCWTRRAGWCPSSPITPPSPSPPV